MNPITSRSSRIRSHRAPVRLAAACWSICGLALITGLATAEEYDPISTPEQPGLVKQEFVYNQADFPQCHASTIEATKNGLVCAWFGGTHEKNDDVAIWVARYDGKKWTEPEQVDDGVQEGHDYPCWNPVLFQPTEGPLLLFYKVGPNPREWWGMVSSSKDGGRSWSKGKKLPDGILGPVKNKPIQLADGTLLAGSSTEHNGWRVHMEWTADNGRTWKKTQALNDGKEFGAIQPTILKHGNVLQILCRSQQGSILESWSKDKGQTWTPLRRSALVNNNSGLDAVNLSDGSSLLVYNHTRRGRSPLNLAWTKDGRQFQAAMVLEDQPGEYSYPAIIQTDDGMVHITYTFKRRRVKHVVVDPTRLDLREIKDGQWPASRK